MTTQCTGNNQSSTPPPFYGTIVVPEGKGMEAVEYYKEALKAKEEAIYKNKDGTLMHGFMRSDFGFPLAIDEFTPKECHVNPVEDMPKRGSAMYMAINVCKPHSADDAVESMRTAGAQVTHEPRDLFYGHRVGRVVDKFGVAWSFANEVENFDMENMTMPDKWGH